MAASFAEAADLGFNPKRTGQTLVQHFADKGTQFSES